MDLQARIETIRRELESLKSKRDRLLGQAEASKKELADLEQTLEREYGIKFSEVSEMISSLQNDIDKDLKQIELLLKE